MSVLFFTKSRLIRHQLSVWHCRQFKTWCSIHVGFGYESYEKRNRGESGSVESGRSGVKMVFWRKVDSPNVEKWTVPRRKVVHFFSLNDFRGYLFWIRTFVAFSCIFCSLFSAYSSCFILANFSLFVWASLEYWFGRFSFRRAVNSFTYFFSTFPLPYMEFFTGLYWAFCTGPHR